MKQLRQKHAVILEKLGHDCTYANFQGSVVQHRGTLGWPQCQETGVVWNEAKYQTKMVK